MHTYLKWYIRHPSFLAHQRLLLLLPSLSLSLTFRQRFYIHLSHLVERTGVLRHPAAKVRVHLRRDVGAVQRRTDLAPVGHAVVDTAVMVAPEEKGIVQMAVRPHPSDERRQLFHRLEVVHIDVGARHHQLGVVAAPADDRDLATAEGFPVFLRHVVAAVAVLEGQHELVATKLGVAGRVVSPADVVSAAAVGVHGQVVGHLVHQLVAAPVVDAAAGHPEDPQVVLGEHVIVDVIVGW